MASSLEARLAELVRLEQGVLRELLRLAELDTARNLPPSTFHHATVRLRASLRQHSALADEACAAALESERPAEREAVLQQVRQHRAEGATLLNALRELTVKVHNSRGEHEAAERHSLLDEAAAAEGRSGLSARAGAKTAKDVTESLRRTRQIMADEVQRAESTLRTLDTQGKSLKDTMLEQRGVGSSISMGKRALSKLQRREFTDKILLMLSFSFFLLVVFYIFKRRVGIPSFSFSSLMRAPEAPVYTPTVSMSDAPVLEPTGGQPSFDQAAATLMPSPAVFAEEHTVSAGVPQQSHEHSATYKGEL